MSANQDYKELFKTLNEEAVEYLVVGAHAVTYYAEPRYTKDMDVWINPTIKNAKRVWSALSKFGAPLQDMTEKDFTDTDVIYQIGVEPNRIDVLMGIVGVEFTEAYRNAVHSTYDRVPIKIMGKKDLIKAKKASGRKSDLLDVERLQDKQE